jgi:hypothetical protein
MLGSLWAVVFELSNYAHVFHVRSPFASQFVMAVYAQASSASIRLRFRVSRYASLVTVLKLRWVPFAGQPCLRASFVPFLTPRNSVASRVVSGRVRPGTSSAIIECLLVGHLRRGRNPLRVHPAPLRIALPTFTSIAIAV